MSVKLIVVALLAATATTVAAGTTAKKVVTVKTCTSGSNCDCAATDSNTKEYTVGTCSQKDDPNIYWKVDSCPAGAADKVVVKGYTTSNCAPKTTTFPKCKAVSYHKATCGANDEEVNTVYLVTGCTPLPTTDCTSTNCCSTSARGCSDKRSFANTNTCKGAKGKYYKLITELSNGDCPTGDITFMEFKTEDDCSQDNNGVEIAIPKDECSPHYYQNVICDPPQDNTPGKVTFRTCSHSDCTERCTEDADSAIPLKTYKERDDETLYLESCPAQDAAIEFEAYAAVKEYAQGCNDNTKVTCEEPTTTTTETTTTVSTSESSTTATTTTTTTTDSNHTNADNNSTDSNDTNTDNNSTDSNFTSIDSNDASTSLTIASSHSVGVLALVLCVLACVY